MGLGHFGAPRGSRKHAGVDFVVTPGQPVMSPIEGVITRVTIPYASDSRWKGFEISGSGRHEGYTIKIFYMNPDTRLLYQSVRPGDVIGTAQDISLKYAPAMKPHIHLEVRQGGSLLDPLPFFQS